MTSHFFHKVNQETPISIIEVDTATWTKSYEELDEELIDVPDCDIDAKWPSLYLEEASVKQMASKIHSLFIHSDAVWQICIPHDVLLRTEKRIKRINLYGPETFYETLKEPLRTLKNGILPRFYRSNMYVDMTTRVADCNILPPAHELIVPAPPTIIEFNASDLPDKKTFTINEILQCRFLYERFYIYLQGRSCPETLICYRMIQMVESMLTNGEDCRDIAWTIFKFFIAEDSAYELSISYANRKRIKLQLANPNADTFLSVKQYVFATLETLYTSFTTMEEYRSLAADMRKKYMEENKNRRGSWLPSWRQK